MLDHIQLFDASIRRMLASQDVGGAYLACPLYPLYRFSWMRDGSFIAHAMQVAGHPLSARRFHEWVHHAVVGRYTERIDRLIERKLAGDHISSHEYLHARFTVEGEEVEGAGWGEFQLDGYGTWLWSLAEYVQNHPDTAWYHEVRPSVVQILRYLSAFWQTPCYDCWEEGGDRIHTATLGAICGGVQAITEYDPSLRSLSGDCCISVKEYLHSNCIANGRLIKSVGNPSLDASLISLAVPYQALDPNDEMVRATINGIETELGACGVHRYAADAYYGGGAWILLAAWLGWYHARIGSWDRAREIRDWIVAQQQEDGALPEQVAEGLQNPDQYHEWVERQGPSASPLTWSHAMYVILEVMIRARDGKASEQSRDVL